MAKVSTNVVIVGAGTAGVTAAAWLTNNGVPDVMVLEAQDYIGGRIKGLTVDGKNIDLGAQFVHGWEGNPAYEIAQKLGRVAFPEVDYQGTRLTNSPKEFITSQGQKVSREKVEHVLQCINEDLDNLLHEPQADDGTSEGDIFEKVYKEFMDKYRDGSTPDELELYEAIFRWNVTYHKVDNAAADLKDLSSWGASQYCVLPGDRFTDIEGGMVGLFKAVLDLVPKGIVQINTPVTEIDWSSAQKESSEGKVQITCENGDVIEANHVIVTVSAGYLQEFHKTLFHPALPNPFQTALGHVRFGGIGKIFLKWNKPFWQVRCSDDYFDSFELLWLDSHPISIKSDKCLKKTRFGKPWWYGIQAVEAVYGHPNMMELWLTLDQIEIVEELEDDEIKAVCHELLSVFLKDYGTIEEPAEIYRTKWLSNPYIRGTYSYLKRDVRKEDMVNLGAPLPSPENPRVLFAGEAYARHFISTFHGALLSGLEAAELILKKYGFQSSKKLIDLIGTSKN